MTDLNTPQDNPGERFEPGTFRPDDRPRPPSGGTGLLTPEQARQLAQQSVDAGGDAAALKAALADIDPDWTPNTRTPAERAWSDDFEPGHAERYQVPVDRYFSDDAADEREAFADVTRAFLAGVGLDRSGGSEVAEAMTKTAAAFRTMRPEARAQFEQDQRARLGDKADGLIADAAKSLVGVHPDVLALMRKSGALSSAEVVVQLAHLAQARAARS